ncbi:hypothetical protein [Rhabdothermincola salaria]|uniref:hypothetical protein n=1 Tax=Rhabdothermincola salaria TaxID=2903142 RepID=UPI001E6589F1|nr:hypothetical protein [Rhabdothermincola salaria]MCD9622846.1 hypothetical protein [Rhabdothermincola salaria]
MADYDINFSDKRPDMTRDGMIVTVEVTRDGTYLGQTAGIVAGSDYRRKYKEGRRLTLLFDGAARHLAELVADDIRAGDFRETWQLEAPVVPLSAERAGELAQFDSIHAALAEGDLLLRVTT